MNWSLWVGDMEVGMLGQHLQQYMFLRLMPSVPLGLLRIQFVGV
jgi:hypothetical protein